MIESRRREEMSTINDGGIHVGVEEQPAEQFFNVYSKL